jgi:hypothetical protein
MTPTTYPTAVRPIVEAPDDVAAIFTRWISEGRPWALTVELTRALQEHRGSRLLTAHDVIWLTKCSDKRDDVIVVMGRSSPLRTKGERAR